MLGHVKDSARAALTRLNSAGELRGTTVRSEDLREALIDIIGALGQSVRPGGFEVMSSRIVRFSALMPLAFFAACKGSVPDDFTSLAIDPGPNPGKPAKKLSMMWLHHSTGDNLLAAGLLDALKADNIDFYDMNYGEGKVGSFVVGDETDVDQLPKVFNTPKYLEVMKTWELKGSKKHHDIIMFKSCFPNSDIKSEKMLEAYKAHYNSMLKTFRDNPEILFIGMSTPPLIKKETSPENAKRARRWAKWVTQEYGRDVKNIQIFDIFGSMAIREGRANENTLPPQFASGLFGRDSHPSKSAGAAMTRMFIPWFNRALRSAGVVN